MVDFRKAARKSLDEAASKGKKLTGKRPVYWAFDLSPSMRMYGFLPHLAPLGERLLTLVDEAQWDDDGEIPAFAFGASCKGPDTIRLGEHAGMVMNIINKYGEIGGTQFTPILSSVNSHRSGGLFKKKVVGRPILFLQTDGEPQDSMKSEQEFLKFDGDIIFIVFGGRSAFSDKIQHMTNVTVIIMGENPSDFDADKMYDQILSKIGN